MLKPQRPTAQAAQQEQAQIAAPDRQQFPMLDWKDYVKINQQHDRNVDHHLRELNTTVLRLVNTVMEQSKEINALKRQVAQNISNMKAHYD